MIETPRKEVYRYLGYAKQEVDEKTKEKVEECIQDLQGCTPRCTWKIYPIDHLDEEMICFANLEIHSKDLAKNLKGCTKVICMATTLGPLPDQLIRRAQILDLSKSVIYQAAACAMIEAYTDQINDQLSKEQIERSYFSHVRYSCGYGDFALKYQRDFIRLLDMPKKIGVTLTDGDLMVPYKSITALIGLSKEDKEEGTRDCSLCSQKDCAYRKK